MSIRQSQISSILYQDIGKFIEKNKPADIEIVSITFIECTNDISSCKIGLQIYPRNVAQLDQLTRAINRKKDGWQLQIARDHKFKKIPMFNFVRDQESEEFEKINELLNNNQ